MKVTTKIGVGEKTTAVCEVVKDFWGNLKEFQERLAAAQARRAELDIAERALNAEAYHNRNARNAGYWSSEALQAVFGADIIKRGAKGAAKVTEGSKKVAKVAEKTAEAGSTVEAVKATESAEKAAKVEGIVGVAKVSGVEGKAVALGATCRRTNQLLKLKGTYLKRPENI